MQSTSRTSNSAPRRAGLLALYRQQQGRKHGENHPGGDDWVRDDPVDVERDDGYDGGHGVSQRADDDRLAVAEGVDERERADGVQTLDEGREVGPAHALIDLLPEVGHQERRRHDEDAGNHHVEEDTLGLHRLVGERALEGVGALHMIRRGQVKRLDGRDAVSRNINISVTNGFAGRGVFVIVQRPHAAVVKVFDLFTPMSPGEVRKALL